MSTGPRPVLGAGLLLIAAAGSCKESKNSPPPAPGEPGCAAACATLVTAGCSTSADLETEQAACLKGCLPQSREAETAGCAEQRDRYLACVGSASVDCEKLDGSIQSALSQGRGVRGCGGERERLDACLKPCRGRGVVHTRSRTLELEGTEAVVQAELVGAGCGGGGPKAPPKAPAGSPCTHHSVCTAAPCRCPDSPAWYLGRACVGGRCADTSQACPLVLRVVGRDACL